MKILKSSCCFVILIFHCELIPLILGQNNNNNNNNNFVRYETCNWFYRGNPNDCNTYFQCNFGTSILRNCPPTLYWNIDISNCDWPRNVRLGKDCQDPTKLHDDESKQQSTNNEIDETIENNNNGQLDNTNTIDLEDTVIIDPEVRSQQCQDGTFLPNPQDCGTYYICNHGQNRLQQCGPGLHWNSGINTCDWPTNARCRPSSSNSGSGGGGTFPIITTTTTTTTTTRYPVQIQPSTYWTTTTTTIKPITEYSSTFPSTTTTIISVNPLGPPNDEKIICYFTDWAWYRPQIGKFMPTNINEKLCTHIIYAFAILDSLTWKIKPADTWADIDSKFYEQITNLKKFGLKITIALGGWNDSGGDKYSRLVNDPKKRGIFIQSVIQHLQLYNFDGIDLDWEYPKCWQGNCDQGPDADKDGFTKLIQELREKLPKGSIISAAVSANKNVINEAYDIPSLSRDLDWIGIMDYDFHGGWESQTGHIAPLYYNDGDSHDYLNVNYSINYWINNGASPSKLVMGIPLYGQSFTLKNSIQNGLYAPVIGPGLPGTYTRQGGILSYYEICLQKWKIVQNIKYTMGPYAVNGTQWVSYDDVSMMKRKGEYIKSMKLGGAMIWALDFDDFNNVCNEGHYPLLNAISSVLKNKS